MIAASLVSNGTHYKDEVRIQCNDGFELDKLHQKEFILVCQVGKSFVSFEIPMRPDV